MEVLSGERVTLQAVISAPWSHATFPGSIGQILRMGSGKEMPRIHAGRVVAMMQNVQTLRYRPERELPGYPMSIPDLPVEPESAVA